MGTLTYSGAPYPETSDANDPPGDFLAFGNTLDQLVNLKATSTADRNARFANVAAGTIVTCNAESVVWMKTTTPPTAAAWATVYESPAAVTTGVATAGTGFSIATQWGQVRNGMLNVRLSLTRTGADITANAYNDVDDPGNLTDTAMAVLTTNWRPPTIWAFAFRANVAPGWGFADTSTGNVYYTHAIPSATIRTGDTVEVCLSYPKP